MRQRQTLCQHNLIVEFACRLHALMPGLRCMHADAMQLHGFKQVVKTVHRTVGTQLQPKVETRLILKQCSDDMLRQQPKQVSVPWHPQQRLLPSSMAAADPIRQFLQHLEGEVQPGDAGVVALVQDVALLLDVAHHAVAHNQVLVHHLDGILHACALVPDLCRHYEHAADADASLLFSYSASCISMLVWLTDCRAHLHDLGVASIADAADDVEICQGQ
jgi:hypothetical protein